MAGKEGERPSTLSLSPQPPRVFRISVHDSHVTILKLGTGNCHAETVNYGKKIQEHSP